MTSDPSKTLRYEVPAVLVDVGDSARRSNHLLPTFDTVSFFFLPRLDPENTYLFVCQLPVLTTKVLRLPDSVLSHSSEPGTPDFRVWISVLHLPSHSHSYP